MTTVTSSYVPVWRFADNNNNPLVGGKVYTYYAGTTTPAATYTDATGSTPLTNPIILNARGETANASGASCSVWFSTTIAYKIVVQDSSGNLIWTVDNYTIPSQAYSAAYADTFTATAGQTVFTLTGTVGSQSALDVSLDGATLVNGVDFTWTSPSTLTLTVGAKAGQILLVKYLIAQAMGTMVAGGTSGQILYNNGGSVQGFTMSGDVTVVPTTGVATVNAPSSHITYTQGGTGSTSRTVTSKLQESVSVLDFGADPTGTNDSGPAFRSAMAYASAAGGARITIPTGTFSFDTWDTSSFYSTNCLACFCVPSNTELAGADQFATILNIRSAARSGMYASGANRTHVIGFRSGQTNQYLRDFSVAWGGIVQQASNDYAYVARTVSGGVTFERIYSVQAPCTNMICDSSGGSGAPIVIRSCWFQDCGPNMTGNSALNADFSFIYLQAANCIVENSKFYNTSNALNNCGGAEMHGTNFTFRNNFVKNCWPAMYIGDDYVTQVIYSPVIDGNYFGYNSTGLEIIYKTVGMRIVNNYFEANLDSAKPGNFTHIFCPILQVSGVSQTTLTQGLLIENNYFDSSLFRSGSAISAPYQMNAVHLTCLLGARIANNIFYACNCAVALQGSITASHKDVVIENNLAVQMTDFTSYSTGAVSLLGDSTGWASGAVFTDIYIRNNQFLRDRSLSAATMGAVVCTQSASPATSYTNIQYDGSNRVVNLSGSILGNGTSNVITSQAFPTYGPTVTIDASIGSLFEISANNTTAFTISNPTNGVLGTVPYLGQTLTIIIKNLSGGVLGTVTWSSSYKMSAWTSPAAGNQRSITFRWNGTNWYEIGRTPSDVPN